jgi:hypothetical protein
VYTSADYAVYNLLGGQVSSKNIGINNTKPEQQARINAQRQLFVIMVYFNHKQPK